ncbi:MAG TPA: prepilin-type N-terminal cleavage/methylation domain-containing protein [Methylophilaceae bacterium]|jgi:prepilin-type N-terminal cleavage/methylation domain-containing protein|nr:prepilin-type N-terminal cleavage/methylation domain-containing protein [Burkholderiales bacterium]HEX5539152.1 prepilin-type N-terminal cleavage/methylation domain-containing protein [Methylophilaceae bacterium]
MYSRKKQSGFTLIEIAIVLVIIGLLLGGVLKGQELITSARVRNLISIQDGYKAAFYGFQDRYRALPGDYSQAHEVIAGVTKDGNGDGFIQSAATGCPTGANCVPDENNLVWDHLSHSGFITGSYTYGTVGQVPNNPYSSPMELDWDKDYQRTASETERHNLKTGAGIPSDILAEVDRKIDDGRADQGSFRYSDFGGAAPATSCFNASTGLWATQSVASNCGAAILF